MNTTDHEPKTWESLKQVIANSTGFEKWKRSRSVDSNTTELNPELRLDELVASYLRETLETLAY